MWPGLPFFRQPRPSFTALTAPNQELFAFNDQCAVMFIRSIFRAALLSVYIILLLNYPLIAGSTHFVGASRSQLSLSDTPSAAVIKVGDKATINLTLTSAGISGSACFWEQGFPNSGFTLTFLPQCEQVQQLMTSAQLIVEATPAAAPQNFTATILATLQNQTASTSLTITVIPAIPAWIPWLGILLFFIVIGLALTVKPRKPRKAKGKGKMGE